MQGSTERRKNQQRRGIQHKNGAKGNGHFLGIGLQDGADGGDGAASTDGGANGDQIGGIAANTQPSAEQQPGTDGERDSSSGVEKPVVPGSQNVMQIHSKTERDDGSLQQHAGAAAAFADKRVRQCQTEENAHQESDRGRNPPGETGEKQQKKENFGGEAHCVV